MLLSLENEVSPWKLINVVKIYDKKCLGYADIFSQ